MKNLFAAMLLLACAASHGAEPGLPRAAAPTRMITHDVGYGTFEAPDNYTLKRTGTADSYMGTLTRADGFTILFDIGYGTRVSWTKQGQYALFRVHTVGGSFAYTSIERANGKQTVSTTICDWCERGRRLREESDAIRQLPPEQREQKNRERGERMALLNKEHPYPANFWADYTREEDLLEFMLIVNSYVAKVMPTLPKIIDAASEARAPAGSIAYGAAVDHLALGIWNESPEYRLNHRINVWIALDNTTDRAVALDDPPFEESWLYITTPKGGLSAVGVRAPSGTRAAGSSFNVSEYLHAMIREPGTYSVQWKAGPSKPLQHSNGSPAHQLESGIVTFTVLPE